MTKLHIKTGVEGPRYDRYGYEEITVTRNGHEYILHNGLAEWLRVDGNEIDLPMAELDAEFERLTGYHPDDWHKFHDKLEAHRAANDPYYGCDPYFGGA